MNTSISFCFLLKLLFIVFSITYAQYNEDEGMTLEELEEEAGISLEDLEAEAGYNVNSNSDGGNTQNAYANMNNHNINNNNNNNNIYNNANNNNNNNINLNGGMPNYNQHANTAAEEEIDLEVIILEPRNGQVLPADPAFEVKIQLNLVTGLTEKLVKTHADSSLCICLDQAPAACWPLLSKEQVRFKAEAGLHTIYAFFTDPATGDMAENSRSSTVTFRLGPSDAPRLQQPPPQMEIDIPRSPEDAEPEKVEIEIPGINLLYPSDQDVVPDDRFDVLLTVVSPSIDKFQTHFRNGWVAVSLDGSHYACFPIVDAKFYPRFYNVPGGVHFLEAQLVHPDNFELISDSSSGPTTFQSRPRPSARQTHEIPVTIDGQNKIFQGVPHASRGLKALSFCNSNGVFDPNCVLSILRNLISKISGSG